MRVMDREQAMWAGGFGSKTRANARLLALTNAGLLRRLYLGTGGSGQKALYSLSRKGANLVQVPYRGLRRRRDETLVADFGVIHQLRINGLYCLLKYRPIPVADARFLRWESFHQPIDSGKALIPDGYVEIAKGARSLRHFWKSILGMRAALSGERKSRTTKTMRPPVNFRRRFAHTAVSYARGHGLRTKDEFPSGRDRWHYSKNLLVHHIRFDRERGLVVADLAAGDRRRPPAASLNSHALLLFLQPPHPRPTVVL